MPAKAVRKLYFLNLMKFVKYLTKTAVVSIKVKLVLLRRKYNEIQLPIIIIDEDFRSGNSSGLGIRLLAEAIKKEFEAVGVTSYVDLASFAQTKSSFSFYFSN